jgi:hypothetical protein
MTPFPLSRSSTPFLAQGYARLAQDSVTPWLGNGARITAAGHELPVQGTEKPVLLRISGAVTRRCSDAAGVLAVAIEPSAEPEMLQRVTGLISLCVNEGLFRVDGSVVRAYSRSSVL